MGSHPTLDHRDLAAEARELNPDDWQHGHAVAHLANEYPQVRSYPDGNPNLARDLDHRDWIHDHQHQMTQRTGERAFDRLNPAFGVPADRADPIGHRDLAQREAALALGSEWPSTTAARTTPTRSSGSPARTTAWPTPSRPLAASPPGPAGDRNASAQNADPA
jgi:hypothetical protein